MAVEYPWLVEEGGIGAFIGGKSTHESQIIREGYGILSQRTWTSSERIKEDPESVVLYEDIEQIVSLALKLCLSHDQCKRVLRHLTFTFAKCLNMPLETSIRGPCKKWDSSLVKLKILNRLIDQNPALQTNESAAIILRIECQLEEGPISNSA